MEKALLTIIPVIAVFLLTMLFGLPSEIDIGMRILEALRSPLQQSPYGDLSSRMIDQSIWALRIIQAVPIALVVLGIIVVVVKLLDS
ncbi:MAG: hypothetical protein ACETWE_14290 [Candidatus Bathyarchaeia archaeon]